MPQFVPVMEQIWEGDGRGGKLDTKWPLLRGRLQGGGDPRLAHGHGHKVEMQDDSSKMICESESEIWSLQKI